MSLTVPEMIRPKAFRREEALVILASLASSFALVWVVYFRVTPFNGIAGFVFLWVVVFTFTYWLVVREMEGRLAAADKLAGVITAILALGLLIPLASILVLVTVKGVKALTPAFFTQTLQTVGPLDPPSKGGALHAIVGTIEQMAIASVISVPLGYFTAVYLNEVGGYLKRPVRIFVNAMSGVPSIVAGLFIFSIWLVRFGNTFSGFAAGLALSILMLPTVTRTAEEVLKLVPGGLREASLALGAQEWRTVWQVVLPTARAGLVTAAILGAARAVGETAPLIMTSFGARDLNLNPFSEPQSSLPLYAYSLVSSPIQSDIERAWTAAFFLIVLVLTLFVLARLASGSRRDGARRRLRLGRSRAAE